MSNHKNSAFASRCFARLIIIETRRSSLEFDRLSPCIETTLGGLLFLRIFLFLRFFRAGYVLCVPARAIRLHYSYQTFLQWLALNLFVPWRMEQATHSGHGLQWVKCRKRPRKPDQEMSHATPITATNVKKTRKHEIQNHFYIMACLCVRIHMCAQT